MAYDALGTILAIACWPEERARAVEVTGGADPVLPTPFRIGAAGAAALAATGLAAADLWELRSGRRQQVAVDLRQAVASLRSGHYLQVNGAKVRNERNPVMGMYPAKNGRWSYLHANFPNHRPAALRVPGCEENREAVRRAGPRHRRVGGRFGSHPNHSAAYRRGDRPGPRKDCQLPRARAVGSTTLAAVRTLARDCSQCRTISSPVTRTRKYRAIAP